MNGHVNGHRSLLAQTLSRPALLFVGLVLILLLIVIVAPVASPPLLFCLACALAIRCLTRLFVPSGPGPVTACISTRGPPLS
jgi:hypothetical protein